jgi:threonine/homoserine/homoserine lactone efflux protein
VHSLRFPLAGLALGAVVGASPGPVQFLLLSESARGGIRRGLAAMAGASLAFAGLGGLLAAGLSGFEPGEAFVRVVKVAGGLFLVWIGLDAIREARRGSPAGGVPRHSLHPLVRGALTVALNPGVYVFLATTAAALLADARRDGSPGLAFATLAGLVVGAAAVDFLMVVLGSRGERLTERGRTVLGMALGVALAAIGVLFVASGVMERGLVG